ncbi:hypothetical protein BJP27_02240 [Pseudomonas oryzihabitans]|nr:hypothetical protein BJP27_02240 [Pseudomonas psychrotolerans]
MAQIDCSPGAPDVIHVQVQITNHVIPNSRTNPSINQRHIFCGEINVSGNATGFHAQPGGHSPTIGAAAGSPVAADITGGSAYIVQPGTAHPGPYRYKANVRIRNAGGAFIPKLSPSTFFPNDCSKDQIIASIRYAYQHPYKSVTPTGSDFNGPSAPYVSATDYCLGENGYPFTVGGFLNQIGGVWILNSAFPIATY